MYLMLVFNYVAMPPFELDLQFICRRRLWRSSSDFRVSRCASHPFSVVSATGGWVEHYFFLSQ